MAISHFGSSIVNPCPSSLPGGIYTLHFSGSAQTLKAFATGPNVPAINGHAVDANHQRLRKSVNLHLESEQV
jgi:hypothetical protein